MQQSQIFFCEECGAANDSTASQCVACHCQLSHLPGSLPAPPQVTPVQVAPRPVREVMASQVVTSAGQHAPIEFLPGTLLLGRYQIVREIGQGGFSIVYLAEDLKMKRNRVAVKRIYLRNLTPRQTIDATETCNREIKMLSLLRFVEGVPRFYESFTDQENWYLVMDYIQGQTLEEYIQQAPGGHLSEREAIIIGQQLATILHNIHQSNPQVIFRDVKPANIMITPDHKFYLIDFGIARFFTRGQKKDTTPLGSPGYAPSEQYGRRQTDVRADIYSLGMTLQTLMTGRDPLELTQGEASRNPSQPSFQLRRLFDKMQAREVEQRPSDMQEIVRRLRFIELLGYGDWMHRLLSLTVGIAVGLLFDLVLLLIYYAHSSGFFLIAFSWIWILIANWQKKKQTLLSRRRFYNVFFFIGAGILILAGLFLFFTPGFFPLFPFFHPYFFHY